MPPGRTWPNVGERYQSRDKRDAGLIVKVLAVDLDAGRLQIQRYNKTWVAIHRFRKDYRGPLTDSL